MTKKISIQDLFSTARWTVKHGFREAPWWYSGMILSHAGTALFPILQAYMMATVLALVVQSISLHAVVPHLWWAMGGYGIATLLVQLSGSLSQFFWMRMRYVSDNAIYGNFLKRMAEIDIPYHEDPTFQSTVKRVEDALAWRVMGMLTNVSSLLTNALGALTMIGILLTLDWWILLAVLAPVIIDYFINTHFGSDIWGIWMYKGDERKEADHALDGFKHKEIVQEAKIY